MKYIRTKYGIYNAIKEFKIGEMIGVPYNGLVKIVAQADTIEELCDEFVFVNSQDKLDYQFYDCNKYQLEKDMSLIESGKYILYGAIWTDKGLIYVAKMNDKGELELL